jgi:hypothetical protein
MRHHKIQESNQYSTEEKENELERLRQLERELMIELGVKPPGRFWMFFSRNPRSVSGTIGALLIAVTMAGNYYLDSYL